MCTFVQTTYSQSSSQAMCAIAHWQQLHSRAGLVANMAADGDSNSQGYNGQHDHPLSSHAFPTSLPFDPSIFTDTAFMAQPLSFLCWCHVCRSQNYIYLSL